VGGKLAARKRGQPTLYKPEYCEMLIEHMAKGLSFESFAAITNTCDDTLYEWAKVHEEFSAAKKAAFQKCRLFWENLGVSHIMNESFGKGEGSKSLNSAVWIYNMKCRFPKQWRDQTEHIIEAKQEIKHDAQDIKMISEFVNIAKEFQEKNK